MGRNKKFKCYTICVLILAFFSFAIFAINQIRNSYHWQFVNNNEEILASGSSSKEDLHSERKPWTEAVTGETGIILVHGPDKSICQIRQYKNGLLDGSLIIWENPRQISEHSFYKNGVLDGQSVLWHTNGPLMSVSSYKDGKLNGLYREWYENGKKRAKTEYLKGRPHGLSRVWDEEGTLVEDAKWCNGKPWNGKIIEYQYVGQPPVIAVYSNGICIKEPVMGTKDAQGASGP